VAVAVALACFAACDEKNGTMQSQRELGPAWLERVLEARATVAGEQPPLLVLLHGIGADESDLLPIAQHLDPRLKVVSLRAPHRYQIGYAWFQIAFRSDGSVVPDVAQARDALADLVRWLEAAPGRLRTDPRRTYLLGFSQGAMMSLGALRTIPDRLAGVVALSGRWADGLFEAPAPRDEVARVPLFVAHGTYDTVLPIDNGRRTRDAFQGLSRDFTYREFPVDHGIDDAELGAVAQWLGERLGASGTR